MVTCRLPSDDTTVIGLMQDNENVEEKVSSLCKRNNLYLNVDKTLYIAEIIVYLRQHNLSHSPVTTDGTAVGIVTFLEFKRR